MTIQKTKLSLPDEYELMKAMIKDEVLQKIYGMFSFSYVDFSATHYFHKNKSGITNMVSKFLENYKFLTYQISLNESTNSYTECTLLNAVICFENECLIIESIEESRILGILSQITAAHINVSDMNYQHSTFENYYAMEEVYNFCNHFKNEINCNKFVKLTIDPLVSYLLRRYFYPTYYFKDQSFFDFDNVMEKYKSQNELNDLLYITAKNGKDLSGQKNQEKQQILNFQEKDFILLRLLYSNQTSVTYLAVHIPTLYIFALKKAFSYSKNELYFYKRYSHTCLTRFYGFLVNKNLIEGFVFDFMSEGSLSDFLEKNKGKKNDHFFYTALIRIAEGINYLHQNSLIHRDLKMSNILVDHNHLPYIADFETILKINENNENDDFEDSFENFSAIYSPPEQKYCEVLTDKVDVFAFGIILYIMFNEKYPFDKENQLDTNQWQINENISDKNICDRLEKLFLNCIKTIPSERPTIKEIYSILSNISKQYKIAIKSNNYYQIL